jgi:hypothetical protein
MQFVTVTTVLAGVSGYKPSHLPNGFVFSLSCFGFVLYILVLFCVVFVLSLWLSLLVLFVLSWNVLPCLATSLVLSCLGHCSSHDLCHPHGTELALPLSVKMMRELMRKLDLCLTRVSLS